MRVVRLVETIKKESKLQQINEIVYFDIHHFFRFEMQKENRKKIDTLGAQETRLIKIKNYREQCGCFDLQSLEVNKFKSYNYEVFFSCDDSAINRNLETMTQHKYTVLNKKRGLCIKIYQTV